MPGQRYRFMHGPHHVRIIAAHKGKPEVQVQNRQGITYSAPMKELRPIPQKSTRRKRGRHASR
jgi:hypothetical protein